MGLFDFLTRDKAPVFKIGIEEQHYPVYTNAKGETVEMTPEQYKNVQSESTPEDVSLTYGVATMPMGLGATATKGLATKLMPHFGKKIAQQTAEGIGGGLAGGTVMGGIDAAQNGENVPLGMLTGGTIGALTGGALGLGGGYIGKSFAKRGLLDNEQAKTNYIYDYLTGLSPDNQRKELNEFRRLWSSGYDSRGTGEVLLDEAADEAFRKEMQNFALSNYAPEDINPLRKRTKRFYKDNLRPQDAIRDDMNNIKFTKSGLNEQISKGLHNIDVIPELREQIENGTKQPMPRLDYEREDIDRFHIINNKFKNRDMEYQIAEDMNGNRFYFAKDITNNKDLPPANLNHNQAPKTSPNSIITDNANNINPSNSLYEKIIDNYNPEIEKLAKDYFGLTDNVKEAGYILNDGSLLDFSGKKFGGSANSRAIDHREVVDAFLDNPNNINNLEIGFDEFIDNGAVRYMPENNAFFLSKMPSEQQIQRIKELLDSKNGESFIELVPKVSEWGRDNNFKRNYELWSDPKKIIDDIRTYFKGGKPSNLKDYL